MALFLGPSHLERLHVEGRVGIDDYIGAVEAAFAEHGRGAVGVMRRTVLPADPAASSTRTRSLKVSASYLRSSGLMGVSMYSAHFRPGEIDMLLPLFGGADGRLLGLLNAKAISIWKTAATAAVATRHLARRDASHLALIGTGRYASAQLLGVCAVRRVRTIACFSRDRAKLAAFVARAAERLPGIHVSAADSIESATREADLITTITISKSPVLQGGWIARGTHCNIMGAHDANEREVDTEAVRRSRVLVDAREQAFNEKGELLIPMAASELTASHVVGELGEVVAGRITGRRNDDEITMFLSGGTALEYARICEMLIAKAREAGIGQALQVD